MIEEITMRIKHSPEMDAFFKRCQDNIKNERKNKFLGKKVTLNNESYIQKQMAKAGFEEFQTESKNWPSLFIKTKEWINTPYHRKIHLDKIKSTYFEYVKEPIFANELFNSDAIQKDKNKELNDWMKLRALDENCEAVYLLQDGEDWMLDAPSEANTNDIPAKKAHGKLLCFGLGIGYFLFMACQNENVNSITVIEQSNEVIEMFEKYLLPQFNTNKKIQIIQGDAFDYFHEEFIKNFDSVYVDIWKSNDDGLDIIEKLLEQYLPPYEKCQFWIEDSCLEMMWTLCYWHFEELYFNKQITVYPSMIKRMKKIRKYYANQPLIVSDVDELKTMMYSNEILRTILAQKEK